jgi:hypothetical protein
MSRPWHKADPVSFEKLKAEIASAYPNLHFYLERGIVFVRGSFPIVHEGASLDRFLIEIQFPDDYPRSLPVIREIGGRIPRTEDFHINRTTGEACIILPDERWWVLPPGFTFLDFLNGPVRNFFLGQALVQARKPWPFGQWAHGANGILEFYKQLLSTNDPRTIGRYLECLSKPKVKGHWSCPCGNGKRLRDCHLEQVLDLRSKIPSKVASTSWQQLLKKNA